METEPTETFGERVKRLRESRTVKLASGEEKKMGQEDLAILSKCDKCTISRIERDEQIPATDLAKRIAAALGVSLDYLAGPL